MPPATPLATYRLQLSASFGFDQAAAIVPYLKKLGISHLYASPFLKARAGSPHGYDVVDHNALNPELGGAPAFRRLTAALAQADLGLILDFVPNHMGVNHADNAWWLDVLEWGLESPHAAAFDIDWKAQALRGNGRVLLPILGKSYGEVLDHGEIELRYDAREGTFSAWYYEHRLPIRLRDYVAILHRVVAAAQAEASPAGRRLIGLACRFQQEALTREAAQHRKTALAEAEGGEVIERGLAAYRPRWPAAPAAANLHRLLERQHFRLAHWSLAATDINYRRFFDIGSLAGLRVEDAGTFAAVHGLVGELVARGELQGLRLDHIDGLYDPAQYCERLRELIRARRPAREPFYMIMEKILGEDEPLPQFPGIAGTTGYEWLNVIARVLLDGRGLATLDRLWHEVSGNDRPFAQILLEAKQHILENILGSELTALARLLARIAAGDYHTRDHSADRLRAALKLFVLHFPIYRTYLTPSGASAEDRATIAQAFDAARAHWTGADAGILDFLRDALTLDLCARTAGRHGAARVRRFALKVQQFTGPMMAKSLEDTAFYRYHRLIALNEVGGNPAAAALSVADFHGLMKSRRAHAPHGLTATATHDTKRGEDARARLLCLAEIPTDWAQLIATWRTMNAPLVHASGPARTPAAAHEYMLYQALLGAWVPEGPDAGLTERMQSFAIKAAREGKQETSWLEPNEPYEADLKQFIHDILDRERSRRFIGSFGAFAARVSLMGALKSLVQVTLKATMPGVPDFYQGTELWDLSLVDPDNRRPVDFPARELALQSLSEKADWGALARAWPNGAIKLALTARLLALRRQLPHVFANGDYRPLAVEGPHSDEIVAYARGHGGDAVIVIVARHFNRATRGGRRWPTPSDWDAAVSVEDYSALQQIPTAREPAAGPELPVAAAFDALPVAVLRARGTRRQN